MVVVIIVVVAVVVVVVAVAVACKYCIFDHFFYHFLKVPN